MCMNRDAPQNSSHEEEMFVRFFQRDKREGRLRFSQCVIRCFQAFSFAVVLVFFTSTVLLVSVGLKRCIRKVVAPTVCTRPSEKFEESYARQNSLASAFVHSSGERHALELPRVHCTWLYSKILTSSTCALRYSLFPCAFPCIFPDKISSISSAPRQCWWCDAWSTGKGSDRHAFLLFYFESTIGSLVSYQF